LFVNHVASQALCWGNPLIGALRYAKVSAVMRKRESDSASLHVTRVAILSEKVKPSRIVKQRTYAAIRFGGGIGNSGHRRIRQEPGRPCVVTLVI